MLSLLLALDKPKVNYFSLDIEGAELQVLRSVPWHLVDIEVLPYINFIVFCTSGTIATILHLQEKKCKKEDKLLNVDLQ